MKSSAFESIALRTDDVTEISISAAEEERVVVVVVFGSALFELGSAHEKFGV